MNNKLIVKNLSINIGEKSILKKINFDCQNGDCIALIGPNGAGKSTLLKTIMHHFNTKVVDGSIIFNGIDITKKSTYEIARMGFFYIDQTPVELEGVPMIEFFKDIIRIHNPKVSFVDVYKKINNLFDDLSLDKSLLSHDVNVGFSGGQKKKNEIIQSQLLNSQVLLLDEIDAGLDVDATRTIEKYINTTRKEHITIVVSHDLDFFKILKPNKVIILANNKIAKIGDYELIEEIKKDGYKNYEQKKVIHDTYKF